MSNCPCGSGKPLAICCKPTMDNFSAKTAEELMRSRYTAYCLAEVEYLLKSTLPANRPQTNDGDIREWTAANHWTKLEILSTQNGLETDSEGIVTFKAHYTDAKHQHLVHHEISNFVKLEGRWYYVGGTYPPPTPNQSTKISRNAPCPCGSGKKHKKCCG